MKDVCPWRFQIIEEDFVMWGYGPEKSFCGRHIEPAVVRVDIGDGETLEIPFDITDINEGRAVGDPLDTPTEYERVHAFGCRLVTADFLTSTRWRLALTKEAAMQLVKEDWNRIRSKVIAKGGRARYVMPAEPQPLNVGRL